IVESELKKESADASTLRFAASYYIDRKQPDKARPLLARLADPALKASEADVAWARRASALLTYDPKKGLGQFDKILADVEDNLRRNPKSVDDQRIKAMLIALKTSRRAEAIRALEELHGYRQLPPDGQFVLALLYDADQKADKARSLLTALVRRQNKDTRHL